MIPSLKKKSIARALALGLAFASGSALAALAAGTLIQNKVTASYTLNGAARTAESNVLELSIREVRSATLTEVSGSVQKVNFYANTFVSYSTHTLTNTGNVAETYTFSGSNVTGIDTIDASAFQFNRDTNGNGVNNAGDAVGNTVTLQPGESATLFFFPKTPLALTSTDKMVVTMSVVDSKGNPVGSNNAEYTFTDTNFDHSLIKIWNSDVGGNCHAYFWYQWGFTWEAAKTEAEKHYYKGKRGHLATITSQAELDFIANSVVTSANGSWSIGGQLNGSTWEWVTGEPFTFTKWKAGEPSGGGENRLQFVKTNGGEWNDAPATATPHYLLEFDTDCAQAETNISLTAAKDANCDGTADEAFGAAALAGVGNQECAVLRGVATNSGRAVATAFAVKYDVPANVSYVVNSMKYGTAAQTDAADTDKGAYDAANRRVNFTIGDLPVNAVTETIEFRVKVD